ncbi:hypothetical protein GCM10023075_46810 [Streptosporangium album]
MGLFLLLYALAWDWAVASGSPARALAAGGAEMLWLALVLAIGNARHLQARWRAQLEQAREADARRRGPGRDRPRHPRESPPLGYVPAAAK